MSLPTKPITIRLAPEHLERFRRLAGEFSGLSSSVVLRLLIVGRLSRPLAEQIAEVNEQIRGAMPPADGSPAARSRDTGAVLHSGRKGK